MNKRECPNCEVSWIGEEIPKEYCHTGTYYGREIGIDGEQLGIYDGLVAIRCPDCGAEFPVSSDLVHLELFRKYEGLGTNIK